jgi:hypothetical protein
LTAKYGNCAHCGTGFSSLRGKVTSSFCFTTIYVKKTQKAPAKEIAQAKRNLKDFTERSKRDEE